MGMTFDAQPSHRVTFNGDRVTIHDLELFSGFDKEFDTPDDDSIKDFTPDEIKEVINGTTKYIKAKQYPQVIVGHNDADDNGNRPVVGSVVSIREGKVNNAMGILGDVEMSRESFEQYVASNSYPRRSAEIWLDKKHLSEVALLGSTTPARPLPDTRFSRDGVRVLYARNYHNEQFATPTDEPHGGGPGNVRTPKGTEMPKDDKDKIIEKLKAENEELKDKLKSKNAGNEMGDEKEKNAEEEDPKDTGPEDKKEGQKSKSSRTDSQARERAAQYERRAKDAERRLSQVETDLKRERYQRKLDSAIHDGMKLDPNSDKYQQVLDDIVESDDGDAKLEFYRDLVGEYPLDRRPAQNAAKFARTDASEADGERQKKARDYAKDRAMAEGKSATERKRLYSKYHKQYLAGEVETA